MTWDSRDSRDTDRMHAALAKRARKAAKREEDARRTEDGRRWPGAFPHWTDRPRGMWDRECDYWRRLFEDERTHDPRFVGPGPRWRQRLNHRRSLPMRYACAACNRVWAWPTFNRPCMHCQYEEEIGR